MSKVGKTQYQPDYISPPGATLLDLLEERGLTQAELAERTGRPKKTINEIVQGKASITPETAMQFELIFRVPAQFWLERESKYRAWLARQIEDKRLQEQMPLLKKLPVKEMIKNEWINKCEDDLGQVREVLAFFSVTSLDKVSIFQPAAFRRSQAHGSDSWALAAWLRKGEIDSTLAAGSPFNASAFRAALEKIRTFTTKPPSFFVPRMIELCAQAGVTLVFVRELPHTAVSGATRWLDPNRPVIQLTLRGKRNDFFWFTFFHEAGHVLHADGKHEALLDERFDLDSDDHVEKKANKFASESLIPQESFESFCRDCKISSKSVTDYADSIRVAPGIVVGRLQFENIIGYHQLNQLKETYSWENWPVSYF